MHIARNTRGRFTRHSRFGNARREGKPPRDVSKMSTAELRDEYRRIRVGRVS